MSDVWTGFHDWVGGEIFGFATGTLGTDRVYDSFFFQEGSGRLDLGFADVWFPGDDHEVGADERRSPRFVVTGDGTLPLKVGYGLIFTEELREIDVIFP